MVWLLVWNDTKQQCSVQKVLFFSLWKLRIRKNVICRIEDWKSKAWPRHISRITIQRLRQAGIIQSMVLYIAKVLVELCFWWHKLCIKILNCLHNVFQSLLQILLRNTPDPLAMWEQPSTFVESSFYISWKVVLCIWNRKLGETNVTHFVRHLFETVFELQRSSNVCFKLC